MAQSDGAAVDVHLCRDPVRPARSPPAPARRRPRSARSGRYPPASGRPACSALGMAATGPMPMISGGTPAGGEGHEPRQRLDAQVASACSADITMAAAAPSLICEELPAVTVPCAWNAGLVSPALRARCPRAGPRPPQRSIVCASAACALPFRLTVGHFQRHNLVLELAAGDGGQRPAGGCAARTRPACSRVMSYLRATFSAVRPMVR